MIALCREHADKADNGSYTDAQLRRFKANAATNFESVRGRFEWMRHRIVMYAGTSFFLDHDVLVAENDTPLIWFTINEHGERMLNYRSRRSDRLVIEDNMWTVEQNDLLEVVCPPGARALDVTRTNGDHLRVEFHSFNDASAVVVKFPRQGHHLRELERLTYPLTVLELVDETADGVVKIHPDRIDMHGHVLMGGWIAGNGGSAIHVNPPGDDVVYIGGGSPPGTDSWSLTASQQELIDAVVDEHNTAAKLRDRLRLN
ncbi:hypothetical protein [Microbacterium sp. IEGM 1404]|uniref:hypothetical protein n=1 Tax=Microbacterium sp. IEGM 1404 TaxID=3047084 RepID=UPI0024B796F4|nr:hypothetical protein [Microbacterium sp. IEGM 1404]MDI9889714.1 hypothetical protein [Microbacterium sp. IEGM 1404]